MNKKIIYGNTWDTLLNELYKMGNFFIDQQIHYESFPAMRAQVEIQNILNFMSDAKNKHEANETYTEAWNDLLKTIKKEKKELEKIVYSNITDNICQNFHYNLFVINSVLAIMLSLQQNN